MNAPLYEFGRFGEGVALVVAVLTGVGFGWCLERGGLGDARKLAAQFDLSDSTVFKVMFSALVTAMLGLSVLGRLGWVEPALVYVPETFVLPQLVGGLVFGLGFVMSGLCPGTSCVALASGRVDGAAVLAGLLLGIWVFGEAFATLQGFFGSTAWGTSTWPQVLGVAHGWGVAAVTALAVIGFRLASWMEARRA